MEWSLSEWRRNGLGFDEPFDEPFLFVTEESYNNQKDFTDCPYNEIEKNYYTDIMLYYIDITLWLCGSTDANSHAWGISLLETPPTTENVTKSKVSLSFPQLNHFSLGAI